MQDVFDVISAAIRSDIAKGEPVYILEESPDELTIVDDSAQTGRAIRYIRHSQITTEWVEDRILVTESAKRSEFAVDPHALAEYLVRVVDMDILHDLEGIVVVADVGEDWDELQLEDRHGNRILDVCDLPDDSLLGISWADYQIVVINLQTIIKTAKEICEDGFGNVEMEVNIGVVTTILHELFHMAQNDPYAPEELFQNLPSDPEAQAEVWARDTWDNNGAYILDN